MAIVSTERLTSAMLRKFKWFRPSLRQVLFGSVGSSIGVLGVLLAIGMYVVEVITRPKRRGIFDEYTFSPFELGIPAEDITFAPIVGDYRVSGWFVPYPGAMTTILVCPGYRTLKSDMLGIRTILWKAGHNVLVFEYYGHGTDIAPVTLGYRELNDFLGAVAYAKERAPQTRLGVLAYSMGAAVAIMSCARINDVEAVIADSSFATHWSAVDYNIRRILPLPSAPFVWI